MLNKPRTQNGISVAGFTPLEISGSYRRSPKGDLSLMGFTMMEVMVTLIILTVLTAIAMPIYDKTVDEMHKKEAKTVLGTLRSAELIYKIDHNNYTNATFGSDTAGNDSRSTLNADIHNNIDWEYGVTGVSGTGPAARATAVARRLRGTHSNGYVNLTISNGTITEYPW